MRLLLDRPITGPKTHAFVLGVGEYPHAKENRGIRDDLRGVPDLPSAADSAKLMCDWLLDNQDRLAAPLSTLEVLISDPADPDHRYQWTRGPVESASFVNVLAAGQRWIQRLSDQGSHAFFYCCGHGASYLQEPVLFLDDLNKEDHNIWSHVNVSLLAYALRKKPTVAAAVLLSDACGEFVPKLEIARKEQDCRFFNVSPAGSPHNRVALLCAAAEEALAYEGTDKPGSDLKFGRFTLAALKGLNGSSARWSHHGWSVCSRDLLGDLKSLRRVFFDHWDDLPFEPYHAVAQTDPLPVVYPEGFELPLVIMTDPPDRMRHYTFVISPKTDPAPPWLKNRAAGDPSAWSTTVPPGRDVLYAIAVQGKVHYPLLFLPKEPLFDQWVSVP
ncbi:hypothetical protein [Bordetella sp. LUAb4]|uniref:hypothetical protein n=1 Tax=Bordetella sp. LUAb4 TaxID=2843195 RepID=UPI001E5FFFAF|nr:hypothetical protein [Bordetella sp. LUAb4]